MTSSADPGILRDMSLDWVTFDADDRTCDALSGCAAEAVAKAIWARKCFCAKETSALCVAHRDKVLACAAEADGWFLCRECQGNVKFVRMEPIR